jgi:ATP-binding cassette, subfamily B, bacterial
VSRHSSATVHELSQCGLLAELPGQPLAELAKHMRREDVASGQGVVLEGEEGDRFYVILGGLFIVSHQGEIRPRAILRPGEYFGEVALAMHVPRTASVRALTASTVASCDQETFDRFLRPLFADDE